MNTPTRTAIEALVDAETAASQRVRDLQIELRSRDDDAFRLRRELEAARADAERARSDAERDCERTMTALRREAAAAKDERVQAEEAHRVTRRRLEEAETARGPQDDVKALLASERIQRLEADLALKTRASEETVAQASLREQGATVHAHAAKAALAEAGARLQRFATRVQELVDLELASGKGQSSPEGRTELREVVWAFDDGALRAEEGPLTTALERARSRALAEASKACDAVAAPSVKALTELVCRTLPARRRNVKADRVPELERALAAAKERYA